MAISAGNFVGETNAIQFCIERANIELNDKDLWHRLIMYSLNQNSTTFIRLAHKYARGFISLHNPYDDDQISLHKVICCAANRVLDFYRGVYPIDDLFKMLMMRDKKGFNCFDYANLSENRYIQDAITDIQQKAYLMQRPVNALLHDAAEKISESKHISRPRSQAEFEEYINNSGTKPLERMMSSSQSSRRASRNNSRTNSPFRRAADSVLKTSDEDAYGI